MKKFLMFFIFFSFGLSLSNLLGIREINRQLKSIKESKIDLYTKYYALDDEVYNLKRRD
jgi:hypothetical protein